jgi:hypothetical protein
MAQKPTHRVRYKVNAKQVQYKINYANFSTLRQKAEEKSPAPNSTGETLKNYDKFTNLIQLSISIIWNLLLKVSSKRLDSFTS